MASQISFQILEDNTEKVIDFSDQAVERGLIKCGMYAEGVAKGLVNVDTGRLRNSITWSTSSKNHSISYRWSDSTKGTGRKAGAEVQKVHVTPENNSLYIGTNVPYGIDQEFPPKGIPYLRPAMSRTENFKQLIKTELKK